MSNNY